MSIETPWKVQDQLPTSFVTESVTVIRHPLQEENKLSEIWRKNSAQIESSKEKYDFEDPLGATFDEDGSNPHLDVDIVLDVKPRAHSLDNTLETRKTDRSGFDVELPDFKPWRDKRAEILKWSKPKEQSRDPIEQLRTRLQSLQETGRVNENKGMKSDIGQKILRTREIMIHSWNQEDRVGAFKQATETVSHMQSIKPDSVDFPYYWLQAIDVLDFFGKMVYGRLYTKTNEARNKAGQSELPSNFISNHVPETTKQMTMHWFLKVAEITELIPRFYVESAMIGCLRFLDSDNVKVNLERLASMCSQFPNDLFTMYARAYICRISIYIDAADRTPHWRILHDYMQSPKDVMEVGITRKLDEIAIKKRKLNQVALSWIIQCVSYGAHTVDDLAPLWIYCKKVPLDEKTFLLVSSCVDGLPSKYLAMHSRMIVDIIFSLQQNFEEPLCSLGTRFSQCAPLEEDRSFVKKSVWMRIADIADFTTFVHCCAEWTPFISKNFADADVGKVLDLAVMRLKIDENVRDPNNCDVLLGLLSAFMNHNSNEESCLKVIMNRNFIALVDLIEDDPSTTAKCARLILESIVKQFKRGSIQHYLCSIMIIEQCAIICKNFGWEKNDSTRLDEKLVSEALTLIDLKSRKDKMQSIELIVKARSLLGLHQIVLQEIVSIITDFTIHSYSTLQSGSKKSEFMRICITNLAITVPGIHDDVKRLRMSMKIVQMCLLSNFLPQVDASCNRCLETLEKLAESSSCAQISVLIGQYLALLCIVPDSPTSKTPLHYFQNLFELINRNEEAWSKESNGVPYSEVLVNCLRYLCDARKLNNSTSSTTSNAIIYAGNIEFLANIDKFIDTTVAKLLELANDPNVAVIILENVVLLFKMNEEVRSTIRGLLKRAVVSPKTSVRLESAVNDLREMAKTQESVMDVLRRLSLV